jgi:hypothetical protein
MTPEGGTVVNIRKDGQPLRLTGLAALAVELPLLGLGIAGCGGVHDNTPYYTTCMDAYGHIMPASYCGQPGFFIYMSPFNYYGGGYYVGPGGYYYGSNHSTVIINQTTINQARSRGGYFSDADQNARYNAGLSRTGNVAGSTVTSSKGGFNSGKVSSSTSGGGRISSGKGSSSSGHGSSGGGHASGGHGSGG